MENTNNFIGYDTINKENLENLIREIKRLEELNNLEYCIYTNESNSDLVDELISKINLPFRLSKQILPKGLISDSDDKFYIVPVEPKPIIIKFKNDSGNPFELPKTPEPEIVKETFNLF